MNPLSNCYIKLHVKGENMIENLLSISKDLLHSIDLAEFTEDERNYIISVVRKIIFVLLIELRKGN